MAVHKTKTTKRGAIQKKQIWSGASLCGTVYQKSKCCLPSAKISLDIITISKQVTD